MPRPSPAEALFFVELVQLRRLRSLPRRVAVHVRRAEHLRRFRSARSLPRCHRCNTSSVSAMPLL